MESLGSGLRDQTVETLWVILQPGADSDNEPIVHLGHELIFCLEGAIEYEIRGNSYLLDAGDSVSTILLILQTQEGWEESVEQRPQTGTWKWKSV
jgi:hypothetical protein